MQGYDFDGFDGEGLGAVGGEHCYDHVDYDFDFSLVGGGAVDEDVFGVEGYLGMVAVYDRWHGEDGAVRVVDDRIDGRVADDV